VGRAGQADSAVALPARQSLLTKYRLPLRLHLVFKFRVSQDQAEDWLQSFFLEKVLLRNVLARAKKERGRFRGFLLRTLDRFVLNRIRREGTAARRPPGGFQDFDELAPADQEALSATAGDPFNLEWARAVLAQALASMEAECQATGQSARWQVFKLRRLDPDLHGVEPVPYDVLVARLAFTGPAQAFNTLASANRMLRRLLRAVVAEYSPDSDVDDEIRELMAAWARSS
jgi:DNA-directed RNA polymerase specialized sigma24 family protein